VVTFGRYRVIRSLGRGGFGEVFVGRDETLDRTVAIKVPRGPRTQNEIDEFLQEARRLA